MQVSSENFISPPIDAKAHQHPPTKSSPYRALPIYVLKASGNLILSGLGSLAVLAIRLASLVLSIFGHCGQSISQKVHYFSKKLYACYVIHPLNTISPLFEPVLCQAINIAKKSVIWKEKDLKKTEDFKKLICSDEYRFQKNLTELSREEKAKIENSRIRGSLTDGICFGATLWVLKLLLTSNPQSESKLIDLLRPFEKGFPAEAAALQHHAFSHRDFEKEEMSLDEVKQELDKIDQKKLILENERKILSPEEYTQKFLNLIQENEASIEALEERVAQLKNEKINRASDVAALIDLKLKDNKQKYESTFFTKIKENDEIQKRFDQLKNGFYQLSFSVGQGTIKGHAIVYIKTLYGSYFFDPNFGLISCGSTNPSKKLCKLFLKYYSRKKDHEPFLKVSKYKLSA